MKKIRSFTIIELVITMVITSVVVSFVYYSYFLLNNQFNTYSHRSMEIKQFYLLSGIWQRDFERADAIFDTLDSRHFVFSHSDTIVRYSFDTNTIVRQSGGSVDSFTLPATHADIVYVNDSLPLIKEIALITIVNGDSMLLLGNKLYSSKEIMFAEKLQHD